MSTPNSMPQPGALGLTALPTSSPATPIPPSTIRIKRTRDDTPVSALYVNPTLSVPNIASKRPRLSTPGTPNIPTSAMSGPSYIFRLAHTIPFQPSTTATSSSAQANIPAVVDDAETAATKTEGASGKKRSGTEVGEPADSPQATGDKRRKIAPVRRYQLSRKRGSRAHPYAAQMGSRGAVFVRVRDRDESEDMAGVVATAEGGEILQQQDEMKTQERKRPRIHPKEKERLRKRREENMALEGAALNDVISNEMEKLILEYLDPAHNEGIRNLPPTTATAAAKEDRVGGGVGGGTWADGKSVSMPDSDGDGWEKGEGYVYDVYIREEIPAGTVAMEITEDYGVIVFAESEDEAWWYEGAQEEDDQSDIYGTDDEDSNAEDYHTNDYPDEPLLFDDEDDDGEYGVGGGANDEDDDSAEGNGGSGGRNAGRWRPWRPKRTVPGEEEYDLDDSSEDEREPTLREMVRGAWSLD